MLDGLLDVITRCRMRLLTAARLFWSGISREVLLGPNLQSQIAMLDGLLDVIARSPRMRS